MKASIREAAKSANAMEEVAKNTEKSVETVEENMAMIERATTNQMRAYLCVEPCEESVIQNQPNLKFQGLPILLNAGNTPAYKIKHKIRAKVLPVPVDKEFKFDLPKDFTGGGVLGPGRGRTMNGLADDFEPEEEVGGIIHASGGKAFCIWGIVKYEDISGKKRTTKFYQIITWEARVIDGETKMLPRTTYPEQHNEAD
ncbi:MAG: hypothetical protein IH901_03450 [Proteobacteria bacterium]|nr:hypothetical protein [Pseudomonadota bacterium]